MNYTNLVVVDRLYTALFSALEHTWNRVHLHICVCVVVCTLCVALSVFLCVCVRHSIFYVCVACCDFDVTISLEWDGAREGERELDLSYVPSKRKEEIKPGTSGCGSFVVPYFQPATSRRNKTRNLWLWFVCCSLFPTRNFHRPFTVFCCFLCCVPNHEPAFH